MNRGVGEQSNEPEKTKPPPRLRNYILTHLVKILPADQAELMRVCVRKPAVNRKAQPFEAIHSYASRRFFLAARSNSSSRRHSISITFRPSPVSL